MNTAPMSGVGATMVLTILTPSLELAQKSAAPDLDHALYRKRSLSERLERRPQSPTPSGRFTEAREYHRREKPPASITNGLAEVNDCHDLKKFCQPEPRVLNRTISALTCCEDEEATENFAYPLGRHVAVERRNKVARGVVLRSNV